MTEEEVITERKNCPYVILSRARGFHSKTPVPTCNKFHSNHTDNDLVGTYKQYIPSYGLRLANLLGKVFPRIVKVRNGKVTNVIY